MTKMLFSDASLRNRGPILTVLEPRLTRPMTVLEIGGGCGGHAVHFAHHLPHVRWQTSEQPAQLALLSTNVAEARLPNLPPPLALDVSAASWPVAAADAVFSANTAHIMAWSAVEAMFHGVSRLLPAGARFFLYGPFIRSGRYSGDNDARFDTALRARGTGSGLRDLDDLEALAHALGLEREEAVPMPANNLTLIWRKGTAPAA
ncbi:MAG: DUF938 domain-containing protein [Ectothiorhodospiraceae bacterium]|nr:DUF938 domain-containing protein [Ectothiorhodospiraceae bacterium]